MTEVEVQARLDVFMSMLVGKLEDAWVRERAEGGDEDEPGRAEDASAA